MRLKSHGVHVSNGSRRWLVFRRMDQHGFGMAFAAIPHAQGDSAAGGYDVHALSVAASPFWIFVQTPDGKPRPILDIGEVDPSHTLKTAVKAQIEAETGIPREQQLLVFKGRLLDEAMTVTDVSELCGSLQYFGKESEVKESALFFVLRVRRPMRIFVTGKDLAGGATIALDVEPTDTVDSVKEKLQDHTSRHDLAGAPRDWQLVFDGRALEDSLSLLECDLYNTYGHSVGIQADSTLHVRMRSWGGMRSEKVFFEVVGGDTNTVSIDCQPTDTVATVKAALHDRVRIPPRKQRLTFNGTDLRDDATLLGSKIEAGSKVLLQQTFEIFVRMSAASSQKHKRHSMLAHRSHAEQDREKVLTKRNLKISEDVTHHIFDRFVETMNVAAGKTVSVEAVPSDTIGRIKAMIQDTEAIPAEHQRLMLPGCTLNDWSSLDDYGVVAGSVLSLAVRTSKEIFVELESGETIALGVALTDTVADVKAKVGARTAIPAAQLQLFGSDGEATTELDDAIGRTLGDSGVMMTTLLCAHLLRSSSLQVMVAIGHN